MYGFYDLMAIFFLGFVFYLLGFRIVRNVREEEHEVQQQSSERTTTELGSLERRQILLSALNDPPYTEILSPRQRDRLRYSLLNPDDTWVESVPVDDLEAPKPAFPAPSLEPTAPSSSTVMPLAQPVSSSFTEDISSVVEARSVTPSAAPVDPKLDPPRQSQPPPRTAVLDTIRASWDPAVMMLYLGALLVVVAGLIFATYNWGTLGGWQKLGMLAAGTSAFLIAGLAIRTIERVKPASTTFIIIGGLLVPANFLAAYSVFDDVQPAVTLMIGAIATAIVHALLSTQPGAHIFRYSAVGAAIVAIASIPPALGFVAGWGGVLGLIVIALLPDDLLERSRFRQAWSLVGQIASGPLAIFAIWQGWDTDGWMIVGALIGVSMVATRVARRLPQLRLYLFGFADLALILASMQIAHNFDGDRWIFAAGLFAVTLLLIQESRRFPQYVYWFEFAIAIVSSVFAGEVVRVVGTEPWAVAVGAGVLAGAMLLHARRHPGGAAGSEAVAALILPVSLGAAAYGLDQSIWSGVVAMATLTCTSVWLGLRRVYAQHWPGMVASLSAPGTIIMLAPAVGLDWGWGCVAAVILVAVTPYPFGKMRLFAESWIRIANVLVVPIAMFALWRGAEVNDWLMPVTFVSISIWLSRLALEKIGDVRLMLVLSDVFAVSAAVSTAWILRDDQWLLATLLLALSMVLVKRSFTWPFHASAFHFVAVIALSLFTADVTQELIHGDWAVAAGALALTIGMLVHARVHPRSSWGTHSIAAWSLPLAVASATEVRYDSGWWVPIGAGVLTLTLIAHRLRHRKPGDLNLAVASVSGIVAVMVSADLLGFADSSRDQIIVLMATGIALTAIANALLPRFGSVDGWVENLLRVETLPFFFAAGVIADWDSVPILVIAILAMFWNIWSSRCSIWSLPMAGALWIAFSDVLLPEDASNEAGLYWYLALAAVYAAIAWQLDRKTKDAGEQLHAGTYLWVLVTLTSIVLVLAAFFMGVDGESTIHNGISLIGAAGLTWVGYRSTGGSANLVPTAFLGFMGLVAFTFGGVTDIQQIVLAIMALAIAGALYWQTSIVRTWIAFVLLVFGLVYIQEATGFAYSRDLLLGLILAWILVSLAIIRWRSVDLRWQARSAFYQAMILHGLAICVPLISRSATHISRADVVMVLISLAGVVAAFGALRRSRELVLVGSAIGMSALMLQINIGSPGNLHAYTVPLSMYLLVVGLLLRRDPRSANTLLAAGSGMLVIPAMVEALTTGEIVWLWVALAEAIGLFLFGTILRLRIPTAAGMIAVSVIALRMLVFAVSVLASWVSILAVGVALLIIGTMWLMFREVIQSRTKALFARWRAFE